MMARRTILAAAAALVLAGSGMAGNLPTPHQAGAYFHRTSWGPNLAGEDYPYRGNVWYQLGFRKWPAVMPAHETAPWYLWWPADANQTMMRHDFQTSPYPGWQTPNQAPGPMTYAPSRAPMPIQPASYPPAPMNFYGR